MKRASIISSLIFLLSFSLKAQNKYGADPDKCKTNLSIFCEYARVEKYGLNILELQLINSTTDHKRKKIEKEIKDLHNMSVKYFPDYFEKID